MPGKKSNKTLYIILGIIALIIGASVYYSKTKSDEVFIEVTTSKVIKRNIIERVSASGKVQPEVEVKISSDVSGEIIEMLVKEGDSVTKGQLLCRIRPDNYQSALERATAAYNNSKAAMQQSYASLAQAEARQARTKLEYERNKKLYDQKVISDVEFQQFKVNYEVGIKEIEAAKAAIKSAEFTIESSHASVDDAKENLRKTTIYSPTSGTISKLSVEKGERVVGTSQMTGTEMMRIANLRSMEVLVDVNENDIVRIKAGDSADIDIDAYSVTGKRFKGLVTEIANTAKTTVSADAVTEFEVKVRIDPSSYKDLIAKKKSASPFRPGMTASVDIITANKSQVASVPISSVTSRNENGDSELEKLDKSDEDRKAVEEEAKKDEKATKKEAKIQEVVFVVNKGKAEKRVVKSGISDYEFIEILSGLAVGDEIISGPYAAVSKDLKPGDQVKILTEDDLNKKTLNQAGKK